MIENLKVLLSQIKRFFDFESELRETARACYYVRYLHHLDRLGDTVLRVNFVI